MLALAKVAAGMVSVGVGVVVGVVVGVGGLWWWR